MSSTVHPDGWPRPRGYSHGVVASGRILFIAGQVGWDARAPAPSFPESFGAQFDLALGNVLEVLSAAGGSPAALCRLTLYVTDKREYLAALGECGASWRRRVGPSYPAMTLVEVSGLLADDAKVELEATAVLAPGGHEPEEGR